MLQQPTISIFDYVDYRFFMTDYFSLRKKSVRGFSYRAFARDAGLSASLLKDILSKRQNLTFQAMRRYARAMKLGVREVAYFEALTGFNNATTNSEKNRFFSEMVRLRGRSAVKFLDARQYAYFSRWYHPVVRELMVHTGLGNDPAAISACIVPRITPAKVRKSIALLVEIGLVYQDPEGIWRATDRVISSEYQIQSVALRNYHAAMLERAREALDTYPSDEREFQGMTVSASHATFMRMKDRIRAFTDELLAMAAADESATDEVFQVNLQMFPFTRRNGRS